MGYYIRAFCIGEQTPSLAVIQAWLRTRAPNVQFDNATNLDTPGWTELELAYKPGKQPIIVECNRVNEPDSLVREEAKEFSEIIGEPGNSTNKRQVLDHLAATNFIVTCRFLSDMDDDGYEANYQFLSYFVEHCGGMIQADREGFYCGEEIILEVR